MSVLQPHSCVLRFLTRTTFEPLQTASMLNTSVKTVFLHSFVLTKRWNTWHALSIDEGTLRFSEGSLTLYFGTGLPLKDPGFNQAANPSSSPFSKVYGAGDRLLCPTRAPQVIPWEIQDILSFRGKDLFHSYNNGKKGLARHDP